MEKNRLLIIAVSSVTIGMAIFTTIQSRRSHEFGGGTSQMMGMTGGGMMCCGGMMKQNRMMKGMMEGMMSGRLPPGIESEDLPNPDSQGAKLLARYCTQCHNLPSPVMHTQDE